MSERRRARRPTRTPAERRADEARELADSLQVSTTGEGEERVLQALARFLVALLRRVEGQEGPA